MSIRVDTERLLWSGKLTRTTGTTTKNPRSLVSEWIREAVEEVYRQWLPIPTEWTPPQREKFIDLWTEHLDRQAAEMAMEIRDGSVRSWMDENGQHPDFQTTIRLYETALENAREALVRQELYDKIPVTQDGDPVVPEPVTGVPWEKRWMDHRYRIAEATDAMEEHVHRVWPDHSSMFQVLAAMLLTARREEDRPVPRTRRDQLAHDLVPEINEMLRRIKRPPE